MQKSDNDTALVSVIGDTSKKIYEAVDVLMGIVGKFRGPDALSIATFIHPGPEGSKYPWMVMLGPGPVMCEEATESARQFFNRLKTDQLMQAQFTEDNDD